MSATSASAAANAASSSDGSRRAAASCAIGARLRDPESLIVFDRTKGTIRVFRSEGFLTDGWIYAWRRAEYPPGEGGAKHRSAGRGAGARRGRGWLVLRRGDPCHQDGEGRV